MDAHVEAFLDGDLPTEAHTAFAAARAEWDEELAQAARIRDGLRTLPRPTCPPEVMQHVLAHVRAHRRASWQARLQDWWRTAPSLVLRPALAAALLIGVVCAVAWLGRPEASTPATVAAAAPPEVQQALADVRWTLALLSDVGRTTGATVREDVLEPHVVVPMQQALAPLWPAPGTTQRPL